MEHLGNYTHGIRRGLFGILGTLTLIAAGLGAWIAFELRDNYTEIRWASQAARLADAALRAGAMHARERGYAAGLLGSPRLPAPQARAELHRLRQSADTHYQEALGPAREMVQREHAHPLAGVLGALQTQHDALDTARANVDRALTGARTAITADAWIKISNGFIDTLAHVRRDAFAPRNPVHAIQQSAILLESAYRISEYTGRERALVATVIAAGRSFTEPERVALQNFRAHVEENLVTLADAVADGGNPEAQRAYGRLRGDFLERYERLRQAVTRASRDRAPYPVTSETWYAEATRAIDTVLEVSDAIGRRAAAQARESQAAFARSLYLLIFTLLAVTALIALAALATRRRILRPLAQLIDAANDIAEGVLDRPIVPARRDEIGRLAAAFEEMRRALLEHISRIGAAEAVVREREARLRNILDMAGDAIISIDESQRIILFNKTAERIFGYRGDEALGKPLSLLLPWEHWDRHAAHVRAFAAAPEDMRAMNPHGSARAIHGQRKDGTIFPAEAGISKLRFAGELLFTVVLRDVSERRKTEQSLATATKRLRYLMDQNPAVIYATSPSGDFRITFISQNIYTLLGYTPDEVLQHLNFWAEHIHPDDAPALFSQLPYLVRQGRQTHKYRFRRADGQYRWMHGQMRVAYDENGQPAEVIGSMTDITDLHQMQEQLLLSHKELQEVQQQLVQSEKMASIGQLAAGVAHEINNPVGYISSNLGTLERYVEDMRQVLAVYEAAEAHIADSETSARIKALKEKADLAYLLEDIGSVLKESQEGVQRVKKIVQDLKDFSRIDEAEWQWADLHRGLDSTLNIVHSEIKYKAEVAKEYGELPPVECLASQLNQVFMNLLVNAAHAIETRGTITIRTGTENDWAWVEIADTGCGIKPEHLKRIFDPFFTTKPVGKGTGLGLSLAYGIVGKHGGRIEVKSELGKGTSFRVWLPIRQQAAKADAAEPPRASAAG